MKQEEHKLKKQITPTKVANFLRELADAFEISSTGTIASGELEDLINNYKKISLDIKLKSDQVVLKMKVKKSDLSMLSDVEPQGKLSLKANINKPKYKSLKEQMESTFKAIQTSLKQSRLPTQELVQQFCDDSELMVTYFEKGNPEYPMYSQMINELKTAFEGKDYIRFKSTVETLDRLKKECHDKYK